MKYVLAETMNAIWMENMVHVSQEQLEKKLFPTWSPKNTAKMPQLDKNGNHGMSGL